MKQKQKDKLADNLPACAADFIKLVIKKMRYRKKVRRDVQAELAAHFEDELKGIKTEAEREQKARKIVGKFGDAKLLAVLLRRAKKRCRPLWRTMVVRAFQTVGVLILCFILYTVWFLTGKPTVRVDYLAQLNQIAQPQISSEDNAWPYYERAIELYVSPHERIARLVDRGRRNDMKTGLRFSELDKDEQSKILKWIDENETSWNDLTPKQKQVLKNCFEEGLVPYRFDNGKYPGGGYRPFDSAVVSVLWAIENHPAYERMQPYLQRIWKNMPALIEYVWGERYIKFDPNELLDAKIIQWVKQEKITEDFQKSIEVGVLKQWTSGLVPAKSLFDGLLPFEKKLVLKWIEENEMCWQQFAVGSSRPHCYREYTIDKNDMLLSVLLPHLATLRHFVMIGLWRSRMHIEQDETAQALDDCLAVARAGGHWQGWGTIVEQLVGLSMVNIGHDEILHIVSTKNISAADMKHLQQQLSQIYPTGYPLMNIEGERLVFHDVVQHTFTDGGPGGGHLIPSRLSFIDEVTGGGLDGIDELIGCTAVGMIHARRDQTIRIGNEIYDRLSGISKMTPYKRKINEVIEGEDIISALPMFRYSLIRAFIPSLSRACEFAYRCKALHEATLTVLALKRWRLEKGHYPMSLNELVMASYIEQVPMDPYSDKRVIYKKTDDSFVLYSLGPDFDDDGGVENPEDSQKRRQEGPGDEVFWPVTKSEEKKERYGRPI